MKHVVIAGSTRGIGFGLAGAFLNLGCAVTLSGRAQSTVDQAVEKLNKEHAGQALDGIACDVREYPQVQALWKGAFARFGKSISGSTTPDSAGLKPRYGGSRPSKLRRSSPPTCWA